VCIFRWGEKKITFDKLNRALNTNNPFTSSREPVAFLVKGVNKPVEREKNPTKDERRNNALFQFPTVENAMTRADEWKIQ
jgi:hypothetical protein